MRCVYPKCDGTVTLCGPVGFCRKCREPVQACPKCGSPNRAFAYFCHTCGTGIEYPPFQPASLLDGGAPAFSQPASKALVSEPFWVAPAVFGGYLWLLSGTGQIYRYSPYSAQPVPVHVLGGGFERCAFAIRRIRSPHGPPEGEPWLLAASRSALKGFGLVSRQPKEIVSLPEGEEILSDSLEDYVTVDSDPDRAYCLSRAGSEIRLTSADIQNGEIQRLPVPAGPIVGPFRSGDVVFVYSETHLYAFSDGGMRSQAFPAGFRAWTKHAVRDLKPALGQVPYILCGRAVYIPGTSAGRNAFLLQPLKGGAGETAVIPLAEEAGEATYSADAVGQPVLSLHGRITTLVGAASREIKSDEQLSPRRPAFVNGPICAGIAETHGGEKLRFFAAGRVYDFPVSHLPRFEECINLYGLGSAVVMAYLTDSQQLGIASWHAG